MAFRKWFSNSTCGLGLRPGHEKRRGWCKDSPINSCPTGPFANRADPHELVSESQATFDGGDTPIFDTENEVFLTNAVFRLPPGDGGKPLRKPSPDEIVFYKPFLLEIIRLVNPSIMLLSGNAATESILGQTGITRLRGQWFPWHGRWVMPIFHPAYLLRNPSRKPGGPKALTWTDIQEVRRKYEELSD